MVNDNVRRTKWFFDPHVALGFDDAQLTFIDKHELYFSTAYIGMVRCYWHNKTIWQTSAYTTIINCIEESPDLIDYISLSEQAQNFINMLMQMTDVQWFLEQTSNLGLFQ